MASLGLSSFSVWSPMASLTPVITQTKCTTRTCIWAWGGKKMTVQMCNQVNTVTVFFHPLCISQQIFSQATMARERWSIASGRSEGRQTSLPPLNTFEHFFLRTAGPCPVLQPDHPLLLVDQTHGAWSLHWHDQDKIPFKDAAERISICLGKKKKLKKK